MLHPMVPSLSITELNRLPKDDFVAAIRPVFEEIDDPWIAERTWQSAPFRDIESLHRAMISAVDRACTHEQTDLLRRQPCLQDRKGGLYFRRFSPAQQEQLAEDLAIYEERFGYPFVGFCKNCSTTDIMNRLSRRLTHPPQLERITALAEVAKIARERLDALFLDENPVPANSSAVLAINEPARTASGL
jgi:2-oxo-4-hydroxy-4-carboxy-5-ureidoimidazoline decarboxylase